MTSTMNWKLCMFCQNDEISTHAVSQLDALQRMLDAVKHDTVMRTQFAGVSDLIAAGGIYHLSRWAVFKRRMESASPSTIFTEDLELTQVFEIPSFHKPVFIFFSNFF